MRLRIAALLLLFTAPLVAQQSGTVVYDVNTDPTLQESWALLKYVRNATQAGPNFDPNAGDTMVSVLEKGTLQKRWDGVYASLPSDMQNLIGPCMKTVPDAIRLTIEGWKLVYSRQSNRSGRQRGARDPNVERGNQFIQQAKQLLTDAIACWYGAQRFYIERVRYRRETRKPPQTEQPRPIRPQPPFDIFPPAHGGELNDCPKKLGAANEGIVQVDLLTSVGYTIYEVGALQFGYRTSPLFGTNEPPCPYFVNGSFSANGRTASPIRIGRHVSEGVDKKTIPYPGKSTAGECTTDYRGGVSLARDSIIIRRQRGRSPSQIDQVFGAGIPFMGGGAFLVENGRLVSSEDLFRCQGFVDTQHVGEKTYLRKGTEGIRAGQFRNANHILIAKGSPGPRQPRKTYIIVTPVVGHGVLQEQMWEAGFDDVVMFDGGGGFCWYDHGWRSTGQNPLGMCFTPARIHRPR